MTTNDTTRLSAPAFTIDSRSTVNEVLLHHPAAVKVFAAFGVHTCCGGGNPLDVAARDAGIEPELLLDALESAVGKGAR
jgi:iron-sulfur cluster repair protein YtfE (RIC family)